MAQVLMFAVGKTLGTQTLAHTVDACEKVENELLIKLKVLAYGGDGDGVACPMGSPVLHRLDVLKKHDNCELVTDSNQTHTHTLHDLLQTSPAVANEYMKALCVAG